jgi:rubrerythrin
MGLRCSVLGHDYGETGVERERDERGEEVVRTATRVRTCRNCGHERTVSANTEITALDPEAGMVRDGDGRVIAATAEENVAADGTGTITIEDGALGGRTATDDAAGSTDDAASSTENAAVSLDEISRTDNQTQSTTEPAGDSTATENESDATATEPATDIATSEQTTEHEPDTTATDTATTDTESEIPIVEASGTDDPTDEPGRAPGEWPAEPSAESTGRTGDGLGSLTPIDDAADTRARRNAQSLTEPLSEGWTPEEDETRAKEESATGTTGAAGSVEPGDTFACRECGFTAAIVDSPLRAGDSCPECRTGYLARGTRKG